MRRTEATLKLMAEGPMRSAVQSGRSLSQAPRQLEMRVCFANTQLVRINAYLWLDSKRTFRRRSAKKNRKRDEGVPEAGMSQHAREGVEGSHAIVLWKAHDLRALSKRFFSNQTALGWRGGRLMATVGAIER